MKSWLSKILKGLSVFECGLPHITSSLHGPWGMMGARGCYFLPGDFYVTVVTHASSLTWYIAYGGFVVKWDQLLGWPHNFWPLRFCSLTGSLTDGLLFDWWVVHLAPQKTRLDATPPSWIFLDYDTEVSSPGHVFPKDRDDLEFVLLIRGRWWKRLEEGSWKTHGGPWTRSHENERSSFHLNLCKWQNS